MNFPIKAFIILLLLTLAAPWIFLLVKEYVDFVGCIFQVHEGYFCK